MADSTKPPGLGAQTFSDLGAGVSDIFAGFAADVKAQGDILEAQQYSEAATLARQNAQYTAMSTDIQEAQKQREINLSMGRTTAEVAGGGFALSGSALDILRSSASQGAIAKATLGQQGLITEAGYQEQAQSYDTMAQVANMTAQSEKTSGIGSFLSGGVQGIAAIATIAAL